MSKYTAAIANFTGTNTNTQGAGTCASAATNYVAVKQRSEPTFLSLTNTHATAILYLNENAPAWTAENGYAGRPLNPGEEYIWDTAVPTNALNVASPVAGASYFAVAG